MAFDKTVEARIFGITNQNADVRLAVGDSSGGTFTAMINPLRGTLLWDDCVYVLHGVSADGGATGGSYTVTVQTDVVAGLTGLPIATATLGPNSPKSVVMTSSHQSKSSPLPTHIFIDQTATGGALDFQCYVIAKQYRGAAGTPVSRTAEKIIHGNMLVGTNAGGFADSRGMTEDATFTLGTTGSHMGMGRLRMWDSALYWVVAGQSIAGTHDVDVISTVGGTTFSIASTGTGGALNVAGEKLALSNNCFGLSPNPTGIIWTEVTSGGVSDARVVVLAKSGRGSMGKN